MISIVTPVSNLFIDRDNSKRLLQYSDFLECRDHSPPSDFLLHALFHCDLQPAHLLSEADFLYIERVKMERPNLKLMTFHLASCYHDPVLEFGMFIPGTIRYSRNEMLNNARANLKRIKEILGPSILVAVENNNHYNTPAYDYVTDPEFISQVVKENDIYLLYDIAHAKISAYNLGIDYDNYQSRLPLDRIIQIHICKHAIKEKMAYDAHLLPGADEWAEVKRLLSSYDQIEYLTIEYYKEIEGLCISLQEMKKQFK